MPRRQLDAGRRHEVGVRVVRPGQVPVHMIEHLVRGVRPGDGQHLRVHAGDQVFAALVPRAEAAGHDDPAVFCQRLADRVERLFNRRVDEAAGVDDDEVSAFVRRAGGVALGGELRDDQFGIDQRLGTAQGHESHRRSGGTGSGGTCAPHGNRGRHRLPLEAYFFSPGKPGNPVNIERAWFCMFSCICTNRFLDCSM